MSRRGTMWKVGSRAQLRGLRQHGRVSNLADRILGTRPWRGGSSFRPRVRARAGPFGVAELGPLVELARDASDSGDPLSKLLVGDGEVRRSAPFDRLPDDQHALTSILDPAILRVTPP